MNRVVGLLPLLLAVACERNAPEQRAAPSSAPAPLAAKETAPPAASSAAVNSAEPPAPPTKSSASSAAPPPGISATCETVCAYSRQLKCGKEEHCVEGCVQMASIAPCTPAFRDLFSCLLREPLSHWECGEDRMGAIRDGYCDKEQEAVAGCVEKLTKR